MHVSTILVSAVALSMLMQAGLWVHACRRRNAGWVDLGWSLGMVAGALILAGFSPGGPRALAVSLLVACWGGRLAAHIYLDRLRGGRPEDARYANLRRHWGARADAKFFFFFQAQALLVGIFLLPASVVAWRTGPFPDAWDILGLLVALASVVGETVADRQLARFRADPLTKGKVCDTGLWRYSRHPNYFFEWMHWFAYVSMAQGSPWMWATLIGPLAMYVFLRYLTGIPHVERQSLRSRGEAYRQYQRSTPAFFPWKPRKPS